MIKNELFDELNDDQDESYSDNDDEIIPISAL
jgi:hypothetical protein